MNVIMAYDFNCSLHHYFFKYSFTYFYGILDVIRCLYFCKYNMFLSFIIMDHESEIYNTIQFSNQVSNVYCYNYVKIRVNVLFRNILSYIM